MSVSLCRLIQATDEFIASYGYITIFTGHPRAGGDDQATQFVMGLLLEKSFIVYCDQVRAINVPDQNSCFFSVARSRRYGWRLRARRQGWQRPTSPSI